jgi:hypothetical protein
MEDIADFLMLIGWTTVATLAFGGINVAVIAALINTGAPALAWFLIVTFFLGLDAFVVGLAIAMWNS